MILSHVGDSRAVLCRQGAAVACWHEDSMLNELPRVAACATKCAWEPILFNNITCDGIVSRP